MSGDLVLGIAVGAFAAWLLTALVIVGLLLLATRHAAPHPDEPTTQHRNQPHRRQPVDAQRLWDEMRHTRPPGDAA